jgi:hypothetical protein
MKLIAYAALLAFAASTAQAATILDLTTAGSNGSVTANDFFTTSDNQATGSGVIDSFVRISDNGSIVAGYNTSARPVEFQENTSPTFTHDLPLSIVPVVNIGGTNYREFLLDINQTKPDSILNLIELQIFVGNTANLTGASVDGTTGTVTFAGTSLIYDMDAGLGGDYSVKLDYNLNSGSGSGDLFVYIKDSLFVGGSFVTLYSKFEPNNDGFEEWAVRTTDPISPEVPEPTSIVAWLVCTSGLGLVIRSRMKKPAA